MKIRKTATFEDIEVVVERVVNTDYNNISKGRYFFDWKKEKENLVLKLCKRGSEDILGLISLVHYENEKRFEIKLLAVSKENFGKNKEHEDVAGNLIAHACREALRHHGNEGCVSLLPKTELKRHYINTYGMLDAGLRVYLEGKALTDLIEKYEI